VSNPAAKNPATGNKDLQRRMYELTGPSTAQRVTLAWFEALWIVMSAWLLFGGGLETASRWFGQSWTPGDVLRRAFLLGGFFVYFLRVQFTVFVFLKRGMRWDEVFTIAPWLLLIQASLSILGGTVTRPLGATGVIGAALFVAGSWMNSYAEYSRHVWKHRPENSGRLYTEGLFRWSRHPNYLGDLLLFTGLCFISGAWLTLIIPVLMLAGFVFINIPVLDSHLHDKYGAAFDAYAARTKKLVPWVY
jgi:protein-S-isoprenylcysteine O-methyltransferase Ste14